MATAYKWFEQFPQGDGSRSVATEAAARRTVRRFQQQMRDETPVRPTVEFPVGRGQVIGRPVASARKKPLMTEVFTVKKIDNSRLERRVEPVQVRNLYKTLALGGLIAICLMAYVYQHFRCIDLSFQLEDLKARQVQAQTANGEMKLEIATLRDPRRIDVIAQRQLGLKRPDAMQVREYAGTDGAEVAALQTARANRMP
ncbi:MAG TPA: cell division protein FtsL [Dongiaceae bacterium]|nr:cell division protein FtsL [Dongiaceae bacterium]